MDQIAELLSEIIVEMYQFHPTNIYREEDKEENYIVMRWDHGTVACYIYDHSIQIKSCRRPMQNFLVDEVSISQAASQIMSAIISERDLTQEYYGDYHGEILR